MKIHEADHMKYIKVGDLDHMLRVMRFRILNQYSMDEDGTFYQDDGTKGLTPEDQLVVDTLCKVIYKVLEDELYDCDEEETDELMKRVDKEFYIGKYVVGMRYKDDGGEKGEIFFREFCMEPFVAQWKADGKSEEEIEELRMETTGDPIFVPVGWDAEYFEQYQDAQAASEYINKHYGLKTTVIPGFLMNDKGLDGLAKGFFGDEGEEEEE